MNRIEIPKFLEDAELPVFYDSLPNPYIDAPSNGVSLLALSRYAGSKNKKIVELSHEEVMENNRNR